MPDRAGAAVAGLLLAAGSGSRLGQPKALVRGHDGRTWLARSAGLLAEAGCDPVVVVIGAAADEVRPEVPESAQVVVAADWAEGMGVSLRAGLAALVAHPDPVAVVVMVVDTPSVSAAALARATNPPPTRSALRRAAYGGVPGHPVVIGRDHWNGVAEVACGDRGARDYLRAHDVEVVECGDLAAGTDIDTEAELAAWRAAGESDQLGPSAC